MFAMFSGKGKLVYYGYDTASFVQSTNNIFATLDGKGFAYFVSATQFSTWA